MKIFYSFAKMLHLLSHLNYFRKLIILCFGSCAVTIVNVIWVYAETSVVTTEVCGLGPGGETRSPKSHFTKGEKNTSLLLTLLLQFYIIRQGPPNALSRVY